MNRPAYILSTRPSSGDAVAIPFSADQSPTESADIIRQALVAAGCTGRDVVLAIASASCLCASVRARDLPAKDRRALLYRLEEKVPLSAEDVVADFVFSSDGALGVCAVRAELAPLVEALEHRGIPVAAVSPASLLAIQDLLETGQETAPDDAASLPYDAVMIARDGAIELVLLEHGRLCGWCVFSSDPNELLLHLRLETFNGRPPPRHVLAVGLPAETASALSTGMGPTLTEITPATAGDAAAAMAARILSRRSEPWVNLRRGLGRHDRLRPVRGPLRYALAAVSLCLFSACAAMLWRAARYDRLAARYAEEQREVFRQTFPRQSEPLDVRSRLDSEERGLRALSGDASSTPPPQGPGLVALRDLLARLPDDVRFRVLELRLDGSSFAIDGQVRSHGDADAIAAAIRANGGFAVDPPRTEQLSASSDGAGTGDGSATPAVADRAVAFTLTGTINASGTVTRKAAP
jgi:hypothetical protein